MYVHVPWCRRQCPYCAFVIDTRKDRPEEAYTSALLRDHAAQRAFFPPEPPATLYFGGGTPSEASPGEIAQVVRAVAPTGEVTLEANPGGRDLSERLLAWRDGGVNRLSLGVQSFVPGVSRRLGRLHDARGAVALARASRRVMPSVSFDLIFGVPGQSTAELREDLARALSLGPDHVSLYGLTIEEGTPFHQGGVPAPEEDLWREMYDLAVGTLEAAGLARYEVSNFALPGHRSVHNEHYWLARPWMGVGVGAHGWRPDGGRTRHGAGLEAYLSSPTPVVEHPSTEVLLVELLATGLRHVDGVDREGLRRATGIEVQVPPLLAPFLQSDVRRIRLAAAAFPVADAIAARLALFNRRSELPLAGRRGPPSA